jgi:hypothetical protein
MHETNETRLPLVETFGAELERAMARRGGSRRQARRRVLATACAAGLVAVSLATAPGRAASGAVGEWLGLAEPGDPPTVDAPRFRGGHATEATGSVVLASGRAPDGARYEFVYESMALEHCLNLEWPDARTGQISPQFGCSQTFPPTLAADAVVKWQGAMFDPTYTSWVQIAGLARAEVSQVRVLYEDEHGVRRDAPVDFARVSSPVRDGAGAGGPVGVFIAFLPQAWLGYGALIDPRQCPPQEHPLDPDAIEVIAYDDHGEVIASETGNNVNSVSGRPPC